MKALHGFKGLKSCGLPIVMLLGWEYDAQLAIADLIPPSVTDLHLTDDLYDMTELPDHLYEQNNWGSHGASEWTDEDMLRTFEIYLGSLEQSDSKLQNLRLLIRYSQTFWCKDHRQKLKALCDSKGINCVVSKSRPDPRRRVRRGIPTMSTRGKKGSLRTWNAA